MERVGFVQGGVGVRKGESGCVEAGRRPRSVAVAGKSERAMVRMYAAISEEMLFGGAGRARDPSSTGAIGQLFQGRESVERDALVGVRTLIDVMREVVDGLSIPPVSWKPLWNRVYSLERHLEKLEDEKTRLYKDGETFRAAEHERKKYIKGVRSDSVLTEFQSRAGAAETKVYQLESAYRIAKVARAQAMTQLSQLREEETNRNILLQRVLEEKNLVKVQLRALSEEIKHQEMLAEINNTEMNLKRFEHARMELADSEARLLEIEGDLKKVQGSSQKVVLLEAAAQKLTTSLDSEIVKSKKLLNRINGANDVDGNDVNGINIISDPFAPPERVDAELLPDGELAKRPTDEGMLPML